MEILHLLADENKWCTYAELQTIYNTEDFYDMLEMAEVLAAIRADGKQAEEK